MSGETIFVVDDEDHVRDLISTYLEDAGYRTMLARDGEEALAAMDSRLPHLVLADVNMPNLNGLGLARRMRSRPEMAPIPILMLSALTQPGEILAGYSSGADEYVTKPVELTVLLAKIEALLARRPAPVAPPAGRVIVFLHAKGGVGTTTLAVNVAVALTGNLGPARVCLLDLNEWSGGPAAFLDLAPAASLASALAAGGGRLGAGALDDLLVTHPSGVRLLAVGRPEAPLADAQAAIEQAVGELRARFDYVLVDTGVGLARATATLVEEADVACVVTSAGRVSLEATRGLLSLLGPRLAADRQFVALDRTAPGLDLSQAVQILQREPAAVIATSDVHAVASDAGQPLVTTYRGHGAAFELDRLAASLKRAADAVPARSGAAGAAAGTSTRP